MNAMDRIAASLSLGDILFIRFILSKGSGHLL
jgi:hypothetical protein